MEGKSYTDEEYYAIALHPSSRDTSLSEIGIDQCINQRSLLKQFNFVKVLVSPMKRAL